MPKRLERLFACIFFSFDLKRLLLKHEIFNEFYRFDKLLTKFLQKNNLMKPNFSVNLKLEQPPGFDVCSTD